MKIGCVGRGGRLPCVIANMAIKEEQSLNGISRVNTCVEGKTHLIWIELIKTFLKHNHRKGEYVSLLAMLPFTQDFWRRPSRSVARMVRRAWYRVQIFSDHCQAKIYYARVTGTIHEDIHLVTRQCDNRTRYTTVTYSLEVSMYHAEGMEVTEALCYV